jgi:hypothetical protein
MANTGGIGVNDISTNNSNKDNNYIIKTSNDKDLWLKRLVVPLHNISNKEYTLYNKYKVIVDNIKSWFQILYNL